jgi:hypothetical protein
MEKKANGDLKDYTAADVAKFDAMQRALTEYNLNLAKNESAIVPAYTDPEMSDYSIYRQLLLAAKYEE